MVLAAALAIRRLRSQVRSVQLRLVPHALRAEDIPPPAATPACAGARFSSAETLADFLQRRDSGLVGLSSSGSRATTTRPWSKDPAPTKAGSVHREEQAPVLILCHSEDQLWAYSNAEHIPNQSAIRPRCWDPGGRISRGFRPGGNLSTKRRRKENARALERAGEKPSLSGHVQAASRLVEELRPGAAADRSLFSPLPPSWRNWGRGGDVSAPPSPQLSSERGVLRLGLPPRQLRLPAQRLRRAPLLQRSLWSHSSPR